MSGEGVSTGRPTSGGRAPTVTLVPVDDVVLEELVAAATEGADADEVTPPVAAPGGQAPGRSAADGSAADGAGWSPQRVAWLRSYHRGCRTGLDGPGQEATWAVLRGAGFALAAGADGAVEAVHEV